MDEGSRERYLPGVLVASGFVFILGIGVLMRVWPAGFAWTPRQPEYCLLYTSPSPRDVEESRMPSSA